jgi:amidase
MDCIMENQEICFLTATELTRRIRANELSAAEVMEAHLTQIEQVNPMEPYIDWMKSCYYITTTGFPAISVPCGFTNDGLPGGVQIVGRHQDDLGVLQLAYAFEKATGFWKQKPPVVL